MRLFALLLLFTAVCPALAADADVKAASVAYVNHKIMVLDGDIRNELSDDYLTKDAASQTYATPQYVQDAVAEVDHSDFLTRDGDTVTGVLNVTGELNVTGVLNVPTPTLPTE